MKIDIVHKDAEKQLLALIDAASQHGAAWGAVYFQAMKLSSLPTPEDVLMTVRPALDGKSSTLYFLKGGDFVATWKGDQKTTSEDLGRRLHERYCYGSEETLHTYYDLNAHGECIRPLIQARMPAQANHDASSDQPLKLEFNESRLEYLRRYVKERNSLSVPTILIVEDQDFSRRLLTGMLQKNHECYVASSGREAVAEYGLHFPCITFLDIELPDVSGHDLAAFFKKHDPDGFIVMVTANNYEKDVEIARKNKVQGFIVKPYGKGKINDYIAKYIRERHKRT